MAFEKEDIAKRIPVETKKKILEAFGGVVKRVEGLADNVDSKIFGSDINEPETPVEIQLNNNAVDQYTKDERRQAPEASKNIVDNNDGNSINILNEIGDLLKKPFSGEHKTVKVIAALAFFLALPYVGSALRSGHHVETGASQFPNGYEQGISEQPVLHEGQFDPNTLKDIQHLEELKNQEKT